MGSLCHMYHFCFKPQRPLFQDILLLGQIFYIFLLARYLFGLHVSKSTKKCQKYLKEHTTPLLDAYQIAQNFIVNDRPPFPLKARYTYTTSHVTYKGLTGVSPSGSITFVSQLYDGSISDKEIVRKSGILEKELWSPGDSVMADRGFTIESDLKELNVDLNIPSFLG